MNKSNKNRKKKVIKVLIIIAVILFVLIYIGRLIFSGLMSGVTPDYVTMYTVKNKNISNYINVSGKVYSDSVINVTSPISGAKIKKIHVNVGDKVNNGDTLITLDTVSLQNELKELNSQIDRIHNSNQNKLNKLNEKKNEIQKNIDNGMASTEDLKEIEEEIAVINETIESEKYSDLYKSKTEIEKNINNSTIKATTSGTVISLKAVEGSVVEYATLLTIQENNNYKVKASILESNILKVKVGMNVSLTATATGDKKYTGVVERVINVLDSEEANYSVVIKINEEDTELLPGMNTKVKILLDEKNNVMAVPYESIIDRDGKNIVQKLVDNGDDYLIEEVEVSIGSEGTYYTEISSDKISLGDKILVEDYAGETLIEKQFLIEMQDEE